MKRTILFLAGLAAVSGLAIHYMARTTEQSAPAAAENAAAPARADALKRRPHQEASSVSRVETAVSNQAARAPEPGSVEGIAFTAALDTLVSPHSTYAEKQAAWKQLQDSGRLADAAAELAQRMADDPKNALYPVALGQAYLKLCATTKDVRAQAIWAMTADADFETALNLDPSNWEARYTKAVAMTYWPASLNKGDEVIQQFNTLIEQQEQQAPQPQFAQTYEWLGKQYQKAGQADAAMQVWQRGAALYPDNQSLQRPAGGARARAAVICFQPSPQVIPLGHMKREAHERSAGSRRSAVRRRAGSCARGTRRLPGPGLRPGRGLAPARGGFAQGLRPIGGFPGRAAGGGCFAGHDGRGGSARRESGRRHRAL